jgi:DnaJ-class molecular chaperone
MYSMDIEGSKISTPCQASSPVPLVGVATGPPGTISTLVVPNGRTVSVAVPPGVKPGETFDFQIAGAPTAFTAKATGPPGTSVTVVIPDGRTVSVAVPPGAKPGEDFEFQLSSAVVHFARHRPADVGAVEGNTP